MATNNKILEIDKDTKLVYVDSKHRYYINPKEIEEDGDCLLYTSPSPRDRQKSRMPSSA